MNLNDFWTWYHRTSIDSDKMESCIPWKKFSCKTLIVNLLILLSVLVHFYLSYLIIKTVMEGQIYLILLYSFLFCANIFGEIMFSISYIRYKIIDNSK